MARAAASLGDVLASRRRAGASREPQRIEGVAYLPINKAVDCACALVAPSDPSLVLVCCAAHVTRARSVLTWCLNRWMDEAVDPA